MSYGFRLLDLLFGLSGYEEELFIGTTLELYLEQETIALDITQEAITLDITQETVTIDIT